jgi:HAD superfamily hydrolase (TIGR01549 family)
MSSLRPSQPLAAGHSAFLFDLDGTLVDNVYEHVLAWREALSVIGGELPAYQVHRGIGMSGGLLSAELLRATGQALSDAQIERLQDLHTEAFTRLQDRLRPLPGARELLAFLSDARVPWAIATSGRRENAQPALDLLDVPDHVPIVSREQAAHAKPDPDLFLAASESLGVALSDAFIVGDSVWDLLAARRAGALGIGLLSGGIAADELQRACPYRVYKDPADLLRHIDQVGVRA